MKIIKKIGLVFCLLALIPMVSSAKDLVLGVGLSLPPYFIQEKDQGIELDIIREALKVKGYTVKTRYLPFARVPVEMERGKIDCAGTINEASGIKAFYSESHVFYQNFAMSLKSNKLAINTISDLKDKQVVSFQNATKYLGTEFAEMAKMNPAYKEIAQQEIQNKLLYKKRTDVTVGDKNIFKYYNKKVAGVVDITQPVIYHALFLKTHYKVGFKDKKVRDDFNAGLAAIKANGKYQKIMTKYVQ